MKTEVLYSTAQKLAVILSAWIVDEVDQIDVTVYEINGSSSYYITFDPVAYRFLIRKANEDRSPMESVFGVQVIDLENVKLIAEDNSVYSDNGQVSNFDRVYKEYYAKCVLRYWVFDSSIHLLLEKALSILVESERQLCIDKINNTYDHFKNAAKPNSMASFMIQALAILKEEDLSEYAIDMVH